MSDANWGWYASGDEENYTVGPEGSREAIIQAALIDEVGLAWDRNEDGTWDYNFHIMEAYKLPIDLAEYFDADSWIEDLDNGPLFDVLDPDGEGLGAYISSEDTASLQAVVREALTKWQKQTGFHHEPWTFTGTRNGEWIRGTHEADVQPTVDRPVKMPEGYGLGEDLPKHGVGFAAYVAEWIYDWWQRWGPVAAGVFFIALFAIVVGGIIAGTSS